MTFHIIPTKILQIVPTHITTFANIVTPSSVTFHHYPPHSNIFPHLLQLSTTSKNIPSLSAVFQSLPTHSVTCNICQHIPKNFNFVHYTYIYQQRVFPYICTLFNTLPYIPIFSNTFHGFPQFPTALYIIILSSNMSSQCSRNVKNSSKIQFKRDYL